MFSQKQSTATSQRLLEAYLHRLVQRDVDAFVLRGGMLMRIWFPPGERTAGDLDLVANFDFDVEQAADYLIPALAEDGINDGVSFNTSRHRVQGIWLGTDFPGARMFASGAVDGQRGQFTVDITFGEPMIPPPELIDYPLSNGLTIPAWACRPETILGRKLHALWHMGKLHWRPKDLNDLRLILQCVTLNDADVAAGIAASFTSRGDPPSDALRVFGAESWWEMKTSSARWYDFVEEQGPTAPPELAPVVAEVHAQLQPILNSL